MKKTNKALSIIIGIFVTATIFMPVSAISSQVVYPYYGFIEDPDNPWETDYDAQDETGTAEYSDDYFLQPSPGEHSKLRTVSYALALAGFENLADGYPTDSSNPNHKLIDLLDQMGFGDFQMWDTTSEPDGHSIGTTIGRKTLSNGQELVVVAPRNYNYMTEWLSNFNVGKSGDHAGFSESANLVKERFDYYLASRNLSNYKTWVVGYSRGGAVVDLFAKYINENLSSYQMKAEDFYAYTFGAPRASEKETNFTNIHDVKDGNDLILGYVFPEIWGFYNTGKYEEINPADLEITASLVNITDLVDSSKVSSLISSTDGLTESIGTINGKEFMDSWIQFVTENGLTREYFDTEVKGPLSAIMKLYQMRTLDKQSEFTGFFSDTSKGLAGMAIGKVLMDLMIGGYGADLEESLANYPPYQDLTKILKGTAKSDDVDELLTYLTKFIGEYEEYESSFGEAPAISKDEFNVIKENLPKLIKALAPIIIADAAYTQETFGEDYSLYYTYTLGSNAEKLVVGHIPESLMPLIKSLTTEEDIVIPKAPDTGAV